ncbi:hypothetical protein GH741_17440 [Aquibacillus halophilus]|uniref:DUF3888 domain-containing protein n=1 Tax=Aquibacillus halophilus TaxID=930132 RepID=A0A6A8DGS2_9BACI|nr:hypothetical protein [Aquibacillus halophilus]MRH44430.1 hypothetical protein [Aquibacillus halophilus]
MKQNLLTCLLLLFVSYSAVISPSQEIGQYDSTNESIISTMDTISEFEAVTESGLKLPHKWQTKTLFPSTIFTFFLKDESPVFRIIHQEIPSTTFLGFISVEQNQANYLTSNM